MLVRLLKTAGKVVLVMAAVAWAIGWGREPVCAQCVCANHAGDGGSEAGPVGYQLAAAPRGHANHDHATAAQAVPEVVRPLPPHGGQLTTAEPLTFEVVYLPQEIRVYLYGRLPHPATARDVTGEVSLQPAYDQRATRLALRYVSPPRVSKTISQRRWT